jgi:hypothetical protein
MMFSPVHALGSVFSLFEQALNAAEREKVYSRRMKTGRRPSKTT